MKERKMVDVMIVWQYILITDLIFSYAMVTEFIKENVRCHGVFRHCILNFVIPEISLFL
jgi:hypothetical protein